MSDLFKSEKEIILEFFGKAEKPLKADSVSGENAGSIDDMKKLEMLNQAEKSKHDRCVESVSQKNPSVKNPHAVCVAAGVKPSIWKAEEEAICDYMKKNIKGVHTSGGFSGLEEKGQSQAGRNIERAKEPQPNKYLKDLYHGRGKSMHEDKLKELKEMPKPKLP